MAARTKTITGITALILDMDGVLWRGDQPVGDLPAVFAEIKRRGFQVVMATNNATRTPEQYVQKLSGFGVQVEPWQVVTSSQATAHYLAEQHPQGGPVFIVGEAGLVQALQEKGFYHDPSHAHTVVAGLDRQFTFEKLREASMLVRAGAAFVGTNPDTTFPTPRGLEPGAGSILAALESASGVHPQVIGKPSPQMYWVALKRLGADAVETLVVGDRLETDIAGAQALGCRTGLVLSGVSDRESALAWTPTPDLIAEDLAELVLQLNGVES